MTRWNRTLLHASVLLVSVVCSRGADANLEKQAAVVLLERYETFVGTRSKTLSQLHHDDYTQDAGRKVLRLPFIYLMGALKAVGAKTLGVLENGSETVITGARDFVFPNGLGMVRNRNCYIAILAPGAAQNLAREFIAVKVTPIDGRSVWTWVLPPSEGSDKEDKFYAAIVNNSLFVMANTAEDLQGVTNALERGTEQPQGRDLTSLRAHAYWAYHAGHAQTSPSASQPQPLLASVDELELHTELDDGKLFLNVLPTDHRPSSRPADFPSSESLRFRQAGAGVWQAEIPLNTPQTTSTLFRVMARFGYGAAL